MPDGLNRYDVVVVGGGAAGVGAAVGAADAGARVCLLDSAGALGGAGAIRNVLTYCGLYTLGPTPHRAVRGVADRVLAGLQRCGGVSGPHRHRGVFAAFDPEAAKLVLDDICAAAGVTVLLHARVVGATRQDGCIRSLAWVDHAGEHSIAGTAFVDASGEADLAHLAGAATRYGNGGRVNLGTLGTRFGGVSLDAETGADAVTAAIRAAREAGGGPFTKERSVIVRLPISGDVVTYLASADYDARDAVSLSAAEAFGRRQAWAYLEALRTLPGWERAYLAATGPEFGTRESRHVESRGGLRWQDVADGRRAADVVALGAWGVEWHDRATFQSTFVYPPRLDEPRGGTYDIPLSCLCSHDTPNLLAAGRTADADERAGASLRVMGTAFATGQAAGVAAARLASSGAMDPTAIQQELVRQGAVLDPAQMDEAVPL